MITAARDALYDWASNATALPVIWADQNAPRPAEPYVVLNIITEGIEGLPWTSKPIAPSTQYARMFAAPEYLSTHVYGAGCSDYLTAMLAALFREDVKPTLIPKQVDTIQVKSATAGQVYSVHINSLLCAATCGTGWSKATLATALALAITTACEQYNVTAAATGDEIAIQGRAGRAFDLIIDVPAKIGLLSHSDAFHLAVRRIGSVNNLSDEIKGQRVQHAQADVEFNASYRMVDSSLVPIHKVQATIEAESLSGTVTRTTETEE